MGPEFRPSLRGPQRSPRLPGSRGSAGVSGTGLTESGDAQAAVTALYQEHALGLIRFAHLLLGGRSGAEDVVQTPLRLVPALGPPDDKAKAPATCGHRCSTAAGRCSAADLLADRIVTYQPAAISAEAAALNGEERREVVRALRRLPSRQREVLVLRYYLDLSDEQIASDLGITQPTVRSARRRGLASLERLLGDLP